MFLSYSEAQDGQILEEGITEAGSLASWTAAGTSYYTRGVPMVPFFIFYSMFGFQRVGDLIWNASDARARGFLLGATAGRTTLAGEGLQHQDGHSLVLASTVPVCQAYDPAFAYELGTIVATRACKRMYGDRARRRLLLPHRLQRELRPATAARRRRAGDHGWPLPVGPGARRDQPGRGDPLLRHRQPRRPRGTARAGRSTTAVGAELWSATSYKKLREQALKVERWNRLHPGAGAQSPRWSPS